MTTQQTAFLRGIGTVVAFGVLTYLGDATHLTTLVSPLVATLVSALAASLLAALDHGNSPAGTVLFGTVGRNRY